MFAGPMLLFSQTFSTCSSPSPSCISTCSPNLLILIGPIFNEVDRRSCEINHLSFMEKGLGRIHSQDLVLCPMCILRCCFKLQVPAKLLLRTSHKKLSSDTFGVILNITEQDQKYTDIIEMPCNYPIFPRPLLHRHFDSVNWMTTFNDEDARFKEN